MVESYTMYCGSCLRIDTATLSLSTVPSLRVPVAVGYEAVFELSRPPADRGRPLPTDQDLQGRTR